MIKINKSTSKHTDGQFYVTYVGRNGKTLSVTETFKTKASVLKNIRAMAGLFYVDSKMVVKIQDLTGKKAKEIAI
jgi:hypothetical protein